MENLMRTVILFLLLSLTILQGAEKMSNEFYLCACSEKEDGGIHLFRETGKGVPEKLAFSPLANTNYLAFSPDRNYLYATCSVAGEGGVAAFRIKEDKSLEFLNKMSAGGKASCYVICSPDGKFLYCANYSSGNIAEFALKDGAVVERTKVIQHVGQGPNQPRQDMAHTHFVNITPDGKYLCVVDLGIDTVKFYPLSPSGICEPAKEWKAPAGQGPRHLVFTRDGKFAYLLNELGSTVISLKYQDGAFEQIQMRSMLPAHFSGTTKASAIRLSADERFLFASNRGYDSIASYELDGKGGMTLKKILWSEGESPRDMNFLPGMKRFAVTNEFSDNVVFFDYDAASGTLIPTNVPHLKFTRPLCIYW